MQPHYMVVTQYSEVTGGAKAMAGEAHPGLVGLPVPAPRFPLGWDAGVNTHMTVQTPCHAMPCQPLMLQDSAAACLKAPLPTAVKRGGSTLEYLRETRRRAHTLACAALLPP